jgi:hypothetical protein
MVRYSEIANAARSVKSFVKAISMDDYGKVPEVIMAVRKEKCKSCSYTDTTGNIFFRYDGQTPVCGVPFQRKPLRDPEKDGCGCKLDLKWTMPDQACPVGMW